MGFITRSIGDERSKGRRRDKGRTKSRETSQEIPVKRDLICFVHMRRLNSTFAQELRFVGTRGFMFC